MDDVLPGGRFASPVRRGDAVERRTDPGARPATRPEPGHPLRRRAGQRRTGDPIAARRDRRTRRHARGRPVELAWNLSYAAFQFVPMHAPHPTRGLQDWGWLVEPDRARRLRLLCESDGAGMSPAALVDLAIVRLTAIAAHMEERIRQGDPAFETHRVEGHPAAYRKAAAFVIDRRDHWALRAGP